MGRCLRRTGWRPRGNSDIARPRCQRAEHGSWIDTRSKESCAHSGHRLAARLRQGKPGTGKRSSGKDLGKGATGLAIGAGILSFDIPLKAMLVEFDECVIVSTMGSVADDGYRLLYISVSPVSGFQKPWVSGTYSRGCLKGKGVIGRSALLTDRSYLKILWRLGFC